MFWVPHSSDVTTVTKYIIFAILFSKMAANYAQKKYSFRDISTHNSALDFILISVSIKVYTTDNCTLILGVHLYIMTIFLLSMAPFHRTIEVL